MPISKEDFDKEVGPKEIKGKILNFLKDHKLNAYLLKEIYIEIKCSKAAAWNNLDILVNKDLIRKKVISKRAYFIYNKEVKQ